LKQIQIHEAGQQPVALQDSDGKEYVYTARPMTKSLAEKLGEAQTVIVEAMTDPDTSVTKVVEAEVAQLDLILHASGKRGVPKPSKVLLDLWNADALERQDIPRIVREVVQAARPT
jgi:hypothetical protein